MEIKNYNPEDYSVLQEWFKQYEWEECIPGTITKNAYMVYNNNKPVAFSYFVSTDCNIAFLGFVLTDKTAGMKSRNDALDLLLKHIFEQAKLAGFEFMYFFTDTKAVVSRMEKLKLMQVVNNTKGYKLVGSLNGSPIDFFYED
jgi:hypothetical protein